MAFSTTDKEDNVDFTVTNHPIAGLTIKDGKMIVSIATNFAFISGKSSVTDHTNYGYSFEETDYNSGYTNYKYYQQIMGNQTNDNDEFMWSANFVDTVDMDTLTGTSHNYEEVSVPAFCGRNAFTEERCTDCGLIKDGTRVEEEGTAHDHHFIKFHEVYYTKDSSGKWNEADNYVCPECGLGISEPVEPNEKYATEQLKKNYKKKKALWDEAQKNAAEGHAYTPTDAKWSDDDSTVTFQNLECTTCKAQINKRDCLLESDDTNKANREFIDKTLDEAVTVKAELVGHTGTCDQGVTSTYKATGKTDDGYRYTATDKKTSDAGQHQYTGTWTWTETKDDNGNVTDATATVKDVKCEVCGNVPTEDQIKVNVVKDTENSKAATCTEKGKDVYTATATVTDADGKEIGTLTAKPKEVELAALGHNYELTWSEWTEKGDSWTTTATFTCANDKTDVQTPEVTITPESKDATCTEAGDVTYTATVEFDGKTYTNPEKKVVTGQALGHDYQTTTTKATLSKDGSIVTKCTRCGDVTENTTIAYPKTITLSEDHYVYDGQEKKPEVSVVGSDGKAISADNYDVKYPESAVAGGSYDVVITFKGNYEGTVTKTFTIGQMDSELKYAKSSVTVDYKGGAVVDNAYTSKASAKDIKFTTSNKNVAAVDSEGNVTIVGPGTATITAQISGSESYKDAKAAYTVKVNNLATPAVPKVTNGKDGAVVTWTAVKNAETYSVWRKTSSTGWKKLDTVEGTTYTDKTAESNQTYYYTIRCMNAGKNICTSDYNRTGTKVYYLAPSNISSLTLTSNGIVVKWNKVAGAKSYRIYRKTTGGYTRIGTVNNGNTTSYTDTTAESGKTYTYAVKPYNGNDSADYTGKQVTYLAAPTLSTLANAANGVSLKWNSISGAQKYYIYRKEGNGGYKKIAEVKDAVSYTDKSVTSGKKYTYAVRALKGSSMSAYTGKSINYLAQANVSALNNKDNGIEVKWSKVSGAKGYYVYRKEGKNSYRKIATITNANTTSYTDTSVKNNNGKAYTYTVRAYANNALAAYTGKSVYRIATPTITSVSNSRKGEVDVDWNGVKGAKGYQIQLSSDKSFSKDTTDETWVDYADGNGITITNCEKGDSFYFRVRAYKQNGSGTKYYSAWSTKSVKVTK